MDQYDKMRLKSSALNKENFWLIDNFDKFAKSTAKEINDEVREINKEAI